MKASSIVSFGALAATAGALELVARDDGSPRVVGFPMERKSIQDRVEHDNQRLSRRSKTLDLQLDNQLSLYTINITVGTPEQSVMVDIDTGSSDLWFNTPKSRLCQNRADPCSEMGTYTANSSSSYNYVSGIFNITYSGGNGASGDYATDNVKIGGQTINNLQFGIGYHSSSQENILGIGYKSNEAAVAHGHTQPYDNLPAKMVSDGLINSNAYSIWLDDLNATTGRLLFGGVDQAHYLGSLVTLPILQEDNMYAEFFVQMTGIDWNGSSVTDVNTTLSVLLDSGTSLMYLPDDIVEVLYNSVDASYDTSQGVALVDCNMASTNKNLTLHFGSSLKIDVPVSELVLDTMSSDQDSTSGSSHSQVSACLFGVAPAGDSAAVLGDTFMRSAYVVFDLDNNEISMAQSNFNAGNKEIIMEIGKGKGSVQSAATASPTSTQTASTGTSNNDNGNGAPGLSHPSWTGLGLSLGLVAMGFLSGTQLL
ncbi:hypothetical protein V2G26_020796 [Clonostachys chloroleuca]